MAETPSASETCPAPRIFADCGGKNRDVEMTKTNVSSRGVLTDPVDLLLADVAIHVQLSRTDYGKAVDRYETINKWIERDESPLKDRVQLFYAQGSMAIGATIASKLRTDEFDIDIVAQLDLPPDISPKQALDLLFEAIRGEPGSRYYGITERGDTLRHREIRGRHAPRCNTHGADATHA